MNVVSGLEKRPDFLPRNGAMFLNRNYRDFVFDACVIAARECFDDLPFWYYVLENEAVNYWWCCRFYEATGLNVFKPFIMNGPRPLEWMLK